MRFAPHTDDDVQEMLAACGLESLDGLFDQIPPTVRLDRPLDIQTGVSEMEILADLRRLASRNRHVDDLVCFAGAGAYDHYVPSVVWALAGRSELYTSYTPYQPELSQGVLQSLFEYQSMICALTGLEVSNASLYDGPTALVEAVHMSTGATGRTRAFCTANQSGSAGLATSRARPWTITLQPVPARSSHSSISRQTGARMTASSFTPGALRNTTEQLSVTA